jgi:hypothetical protein
MSSHIPNDSMYREFLCANAANTVHEFMNNRVQLLDLGHVMEICPKDEIHHGFQVRIIRPPTPGQKIYGVSVALPPGSPGNRQITRENGLEPSTIEVALLGGPDLSEVSIVYHKACGYSDVRAFNKADEVIREITRLANFISSSRFKEAETSTSPL